MKPWNVTVRYMGAPVVEIRRNRTLVASISSVGLECRVAATIPLDVAAMALNQWLKARSGK